MICRIGIFHHLVLGRFLTKKSEKYIFSRFSVSIDFYQHFAFGIAPNYKNLHYRILLSLLYILDCLLRQFVFWHILLHYNYVLFSFIYFCPLSLSLTSCLSWLMNLVNNNISAVNPFRMLISTFEWTLSWDMLNTGIPIN